MRQLLSWKAAFTASLIAMLALLWIGGYDSGFCSDELDMMAYGKANVSFYATGGKDTTYLHPSLHDGSTMSTTLPYYGSGFEYIAIPVCRATAVYGHYEIPARHMLCQLFAILGLLFAGLIACELARSYRAAVIAVWLLFLTPQIAGLAIFDIKDIPFMAGYVASFYFMLRIRNTMPAPPVKLFIGLLLSVSFTLMIRIGGLMLWGFMLLFLADYIFTGRKNMQEQRRSMSRWLKPLILTFIGSTIIVIVTWPFVLTHPVRNLIAAINVANNFPQRIPFNYGGENIDSLTLPPNYLLNIMFLTLPLISMLLIIIGLVHIAFWRDKAKIRLAGIILAGSIIPLFIATYTHAPVYNGWRHLLFVYPPVVALAAAGIDTLISFTRYSIIKWVLAGACLIGFYPVVSWSSRHFQYQYMYYNELAGGLEGAYAGYENDYWQITVKKSLDWLVANRLHATGDSVTLGTNAYSVSNYYFRKKYPNIKLRIITSSYRSRHHILWQYGVYNTLFLPPDILENNFGHLPYTVYREAVNDQPLTIVIEDSSRLDYHGITAMQQNQPVVADSLLSLYAQKAGFNSFQMRLDEFDVLLAVARFSHNDLNGAFQIAREIIKYDPQSYEANLIMGVCYIQNPQTKDRGVHMLKLARKVNDADIIARAYLQHFGIAP